MCSRRLPRRDTGVALIMPHADTAAMQAHLVRSAGRHPLAQALLTSTRRMAHQRSSTGRKRPPRAAAACLSELNAPRPGFAATPPPRPARKPCAALAEATHHSMPTDVGHRSFTPSAVVKCPVAAGGLLTIDRSLLVACHPRVGHVHHADAHQLLPLSS